MMTLNEEPVGVELQLWSRGVRNIRLVRLFSILHSHQLQHDLLQFRAVLRYVS
jgi:hypothetical protein